MCALLVYRASERERKEERKSICAVLCLNILCLAVYVPAVQPSIEKKVTLSAEERVNEKEKKNCCVVTRISDQFPKNTEHYTFAHGERIF